MHRRAMLFVGLTLLAAFVTGDALAQQKSLKDQLAGTWTFASAGETRADGSKSDRWGPGARGMLMFDAGGHFMQTIARADLPKFAANRVDQGTAEENKAVMQGLIVLFGKYSVNETDKLLTLNVEGSSFPNLAGGTQKRTITKLTAEELTYTNPMTTTGGRSDVSWKRAK